MGYKSFPVLGQQFKVDERWEFIREVGKGAYGVVCVAFCFIQLDDLLVQETKKVVVGVFSHVALATSAAQDKTTGEKVAIKKVCKLFERPILTKRALRELVLLQHFNGHKNITGLLDVNIVDYSNFNELYLYEDLMEADLHQIIRSGQPLSDAHFQSFIYQTLCGLKYIHSADVLHRDLKPGNLLICDFGLARGYVEVPEADTGFMTEYVATRWYRAPEIMLSFQRYTKAIDVWSVGCIFAELLGGKPLFKGADYVDQLNQILYILGTPNDESLHRIGSERAQLYIRSLKHFVKVPFSTLYPNATSEALDLLEKLLEFDPYKRISVEEALEYPYLALFHDPEDEPSHTQTPDFSFESLQDPNEMRAEIIQEVKQFHLKKRKLRLNMHGIRRSTSLATPTPDRVTFEKTGAPGEAAFEDDGRYDKTSGYVDDLIASPVTIDPQLERDLSGLASFRA
ncbi:hypothetical protein BZG36_01145 [Bifiguratus adelaidae]|uniref:Protein kinase domain-containing protein n=1 Tax=Bifiguratus adelaidae TaxID=1938954 RepID=A0A261Y626_9FUNG|nr:hypothetical protein BZG36_01145 [Bifiguratus adelaidae]